MGVGDDAAVEHLDLTGQAGGEVAVVRDHGDRRATGVQLVEQGEDRGTGRAVEVAGRLVGEHDRLPADQGAGDRDALALAAGELCRPRREPVAEPDRCEHSRCLLTPLRDRDAGIEQSIGDVLQGGCVLGEEELLEDEADPGRAQRGQLAVRRGRRHRGR